MNESTHKESGSIEEARKKIFKRKKQLAFDSYPKDLQDFLTRRGTNPYQQETEDCIEHAELTE